MSTIEYKLSYNLYCDMTEEIRFKTIRKISTCIYEYHFLTKHACYANFIHESSFSSKKILFFLILVFSIYCVGFSILNYRNNPDDGLIKALPHRNFWSEFYENVVIGARLTSEKAIYVAQNLSVKIREKIDQIKGNNQAY